MITYNQKVANSLSPEEIALIISLLKTTTRKDIALKLNMSESKLNRVASHFGWRFTYKKARPYRLHSKELVGEVISYYEENGIGLTKERFPNTSVRSIIERYPRSKVRQSRWTDKQLLMILRYGPFVGLTEQAKRFNRPLAFAGSIRSVWSKKFKASRSNIAGFPEYKARMFANKDCPSTATAMESIDKIYLWVDLEKHLKKDCPKFISDSISALSLFQNRLYEHDVHGSIEKIKENINV